jgi:hypothetical protein
MPVILATQQAEIRRIKVQSQAKQIVQQDPILKTHHKNRAGGVAQGEGPEFKPQYHTKKKKKEKKISRVVIKEHTTFRLIEENSILGSFRLFYFRLIE